MTTASLIQLGLLFTAWLVVAIAVFREAVALTVEIKREEDQ